MKVSNSNNKGLLSLHRFKVLLPVNIAGIHDAFYFLTKSKFRNMWPMLDMVSGYLSGTL